jgi:hypothetical protein
MESAPHAILPIMQKAMEHVSSAPNYRIAFNVIKKESAQLVLIRIIQKTTGHVLYVPHYQIASNAIKEESASNANQTLKTLLIIQVNVCSVASFLIARHVIMRTLATDANRLNTSLTIQRNVHPAPANNITAKTAQPSILVLPVQALSIMMIKKHVSLVRVNSITALSAHPPRFVLAVLTRSFLMVKINAYTAQEPSMDVLNAM